MTKHSTIRLFQFGEEKHMREHWANIDIKKFVKILGTIGYIALIFLPFCGFQLTECTWNDLLINTRQMGLLRNSVLLASLSALLACAIGLLVAIAIRSLSLSLTTFRWFFLITAPLPFYIYSLSWMYGVRFFSQWNRSIASYAYKGLPACIFVETMTFLPFCVAMILFGIEQLDHDLEDMAFLYQKEQVVIRKVVILQIMSYITAAFGCVFVMSITDYSVPSLFQFNTYIMDIFSEYSRGVPMSRVAGMSIPLIGLVFLFLAFIQGNLKQFTMPSAKKQESRWYFHGKMKCISVIGMSLIVAQIGIPLVIFLLTAQTPATIWKSFILARRELWISIEMSVIAGILAVFVSYGMARFLIDLSQKRKKVSFLFWQIALFPLAIPGPLIAMGLLSTVNGSFFHDMSQTIFFPAIGYAIRYMPFSLMILAAVLRRMDEKKLQMAHLLAPNKNKAFLKVEIPMVLPGALTAFLVVVLLSMGEEGIGLVLMPAGLETLAVKVYNYLHYGASELISGFSLVTMLVTCFIVGTFLVLLERKKKISKG